MIAGLGAPVNTAVDLASRWLGGSVVAASDESFGDKENLLNPAQRSSSLAGTATAARSSMAGRPGGAGSPDTTGR